MLQYIKNQSRRFRTLSTFYEWIHLPSELNPADEVSRGVTVQDMINNSKWLNGPMFLHRNEESWPGDLKIVQNEMSDDDPEVKPDLQSYSRTLAHRANEDFLSSFIQPHSSWEKLKRTVAWLLIQRSKNASVKMLSVDKLQRAEREIVKHEQGISFPEALQALQKIPSSKYSHQLTAELKRLKKPAFMRKLASPVVKRISNPKGRRAL